MNTLKEDTNEGNYECVILYHWDETEESLKRKVNEFKLKKKLGVIHKDSVLIEISVPETPTKSPSSSQF